MGIFNAAGAPADFFNAAGQGLSLYDGAGNPLAANGAATLAPIDFGPTVLQLAANTAGWWDLLADAGTSRVVDYLTGNSISAGYTSSNDGSVNLAEFALYGYHALNRSTLAARYGDVGEGIIAWTDYRVTVNSGTIQNLENFGPGRTCYRFDAGDQVTITGIKGARIKIVRRYDTGTTVPTVTIDGTPVTLTATSSTIGAAMVDSFDVGAGTHTIVITGPASGVADVMCVIGDSATTGGVTMHQRGNPGGYQYSSWGSPGDTTSAQRLYLRQVTLDLLDVDMLEIAYGHNEMTLVPDTNTSPDAWYADLVELITYQVSTRGKWAHVWAGPARDGTYSGGRTADAWWDAAYNAAVDAGASFGDYRDASGFGVTRDPAKYVDVVHPNKAHHADMAAVRLATLFPTGAQLAALQAAYPA